MSEISPDSEPNDGKYFLPEILRRIFQNLNIQDLCRVATVSKSWNEVATHERRQRGLQKLLLSMANINVYDSIRTKPCVALMLVSPIFYDLDLSLCAVLKKYKDYFPNSIVILGLKDVMMNDEHVTWDADKPETAFLSLLIPEYRDLKIRTSFVHEFDDTRDASNFINEFIPEDTQSNATFIIFSQVQHNKKPLFDALRKCMDERKQKFSLWGGSFWIPPQFAINHQIFEGIEEELNDPDRDCGADQTNGIFAMSITGSSLKYWSIVISCALKKQEFDKKLIDFRDQLQLKRYSIGLAYGPSEVYDGSFAKEVGFDYSEITRNKLLGVYANVSEMLQTVRKIITKVSFIGFDDDEIYEWEYRYYGFRPEADDPLQDLQHRMSFSLMILTYD